MRVKGGTVTHARRKRMLKRASGYFGSKHLLFKTAKEQVVISEVNTYSTRLRKNKSCTAYAMRTSLVELLKETIVNSGSDVSTLLAE